jgi:hypothetical protein
MILGRDEFIRAIAVGKWFRSLSRALDVHWATIESPPLASDEMALS